MPVCITKPLVLQWKYDVCMIFFNESRSKYFLRNYHNWWHSKTGHLFQGRYKSILVDKENYLLELCRYVVLNPVRANMVEKPEEWKWSSYGATAGLKTVPNYLTVDWILGLFSNNKAEAQKRYRKFVREGIHTGSPWDDLQGQILLGEEGFIEKYKDLLSDKEQIQEIPRPQRYVSRPRLSKLLSKEDKTTRRNRQIYAAHVKYGYTLKEIADHIEIHYTKASKAIKSLEGK